MKCLAQRNKIKLVKILFSLETSMQFSRKILTSGETPYFPTQNPDTIWSQRTEKQKLYIK
jgi:hypothetical protein